MLNCIIVMLQSVPNKFQYGVADVFTVFFKQVQQVHDRVLFRYSVNVH